MNYCASCGDILVEPIEWRFGYCAWCLAVVFEQFDELIADYWFDQMDGKD
jgi:hypothetical protein